MSPLPAAEQKVRSPDFIPNKVAKTYDEMKLEAEMLEADPFMLEEKRYLNRLKIANIRIANNYSKLSGQYNREAEQKRIRDRMEHERAL